MDVSLTMNTDSEEDKQKLSRNVDKTVGVAALREIHRLIVQERVEGKRARNLAGILTGVGFGLFCGFLLVTSVLDRLKVRSPRPVDDFDVVITTILSFFTVLPLGVAYYFTTRQRHSIPKLLVVGVAISVAVAATSLALM